MAGQNENWTNAQAVPSKSYTCGYCNNLVGSAQGYTRIMVTGSVTGITYICPHCKELTIYTLQKQIPGVRPGSSVQGVPGSVEKIYNEARDCIAASAYTAAAMLCRKILMHFATDCGAGGNLNFQQYVDYLVNNNYVPPGSKDWVDHIRQKGNEVNHELVFSSQEDATELLLFVEMLLKFKYEFPAKVGRGAGAALAAPKPAGRP